MASDLASQLALKKGGKILLAVMDGVGDLPIPEFGGLTPLEKAETPNMDSLAEGGALGQQFPVGRGITPGSGPGHLALFGYDPVKYLVGRGALAALGIGFQLQHGDLAARINFCTLGEDGVILDRRAGRISTDLCVELVDQLKAVSVPGFEVFVEPVKEHRACVVFRGAGLSEHIHDTDPGLTGEKPVPVTATDSDAATAVKVVGEFIDKSMEILKDKSPANGLLLRGFALHEDLPTMQDRYRLNPAAVALYPMYRGVASLAGMEQFQSNPADLTGEVVAVNNALKAGKDFVFLHHKYTDSSGEDGDHERKVREIEKFDAAIPELVKCGFDVICITGDHSTPCPMKLHSWHPVPVLIHGGPQRTGWSRRFTEREAASGALGTFKGSELMPLLLAAAGRLAKFGA
ncbi:phosphoglycerate mutase [Candidatus Fermentibacteria bacterium]|jgi:2,3-bisphosphoglycerate-independent phosphoglycerate mutase|nr:MAG: phosphoglycerate mutase [Candidatus Fermentibacteria bacterium]